MMSSTWRRASRVLPPLTQCCTPTLHPPSLMFIVIVNTARIMANFYEHMDLDINWLSNRGDEDEELLLHAAAVGCMMYMMDEEDMYMLSKKRRRHRFWTRTWFKARDDEHQINTMYKLQQELLQVSVSVIRLFYCDIQNNSEND